MNADRLPPSTDVLIVGAGPAGLTLGATLSQLGVDHVIVDPKPASRPVRRPQRYNRARSNTSRGSAWQHTSSRTACAALAST